MSFLIPSPFVVYRRTVSERLACASDKILPGKLALLTLIFLVVALYASGAAATCQPTGGPNTVTICTPTPNQSLSNPVTVTAAANSSSHISSFLVYVDNQLKYQDTSGSSSISTVLPSLAVGTHHLVVQYYNGQWVFGSEYFTVIQGNGCSATGGNNTVTICTPTPNQSLPNPVQVQAAANSSNQITSFLVYVDNQLKYQNNSGSKNISTTLPDLPSGSHHLVVQYYNGQWVFGSEYFTVTGNISGAVPVLTYHNDNARTGANPQETILNPSNVNWQTFGKKYSYGVDGQIYAQPLYVPNLTVNGANHNVVFAATENDTVYAFDANGGGTLWQKHLGTPPSNNDQEGIAPILGITSTPVIDASTNTIYVVTDTNESGRVFRLHALDLSTGNEKLGGPIVVTGSVSGSGRDNVNGRITLESGCYQRMGLALTNNNVYIGFGHCNHGWLLAYNKTTLQPAAILNTTPNGAGGALWGGGATPAVDSSGNMYLISGVDADDPAPGYNDSFMKMSANDLSVLDYFKPSNETWLRQNDADLGSGGTIVMPDNSSSHPHELIGGGKDGRLFVIDSDNMGGYNSTDHVVQEVQTGTQQFDNMFSTPTYWNGYIYNHCEQDVLKSFSWTNGLLSSKYVSKGAHTFGIHGATASVSSNGNVDGIVWEIESTGQPNSQPAILRAYDALNLANELYDSTQASGGRDTAGPAVKFVVPTIADGQVFVGTANQLDIYGLR